MSTLRISNIEAKADNSSPTVDEQLKFTNSTGDLMLYLDGRTSGITTVGINTTNQTIKFDANNNVMVTGIITATEFHGTLAVGTSVTYGDNEKAYFGNGLDLQIYHDASGGHSRIDDTGTGGLVLRGSNILLEKYGGGYLANFKPDDSVDLFYAGNKKFETTNTGAVVTGILTATTFSGSGASLTSLPAGQLTGTIAAARLPDVFTGTDFGFNVTPGGTPASKNVFIAIGDSDTGIVQDGDGQFEIWGNAVEVANFNAIDGYTSVKPISTTDNITMGYRLIHSGDTDTYMQYDTNAIALVTAGTGRINIDANGVVTITRRLELTNSGDNHGIYEGRSWTWTSNGTTSGTVRAYMYGDSSSNLRIGTNGWNERLRIASNGDIGLGTVPETDSYQPSLYFSGGNANIWGSGNANLYTAVNARYTGAGGWKYNNNGLASYTAQQSGTWEFRNAPSGTADNVATFTTRVQIDSSGRVGINKFTHADTASALTIRNGATGSEHSILDIVCNDNETSRIYFSEDSNTGKGSIRYRYTGDDNYMSFFTNGTASTEEKLRITSSGVVHHSNAADEMTWSRQTGRAQQGNGNSTTYSVKTFYYGVATFKIALSDGNAKWAHLVVEIGGMQYTAGNGYNATVVANSTGNGPSISLNKQDGGYHITITNGGNSNTLFGSWVLEGTSYTDGSTPTLVIS